MNNKQLITNYYITHRGELLTYVSARLSGRAEAEDVVQDVFLPVLLLVLQKPKYIDFLI